MTNSQSLIYKIATEPAEFEQIHALNYCTFVEEIPQHPANRLRRLVDRFHDENTYIICLAGGRLAGMVALRGRRPFSLDAKLPDLQTFLPAGARPCEIRLLAVEPAFRNKSVFAGLVARLVDVARQQGYDLALISGTTRQLKLYRHLGFQPFGPLVGRNGATFQPMMLTRDRFESCVAWLSGQDAEDAVTVCLLPGPVEIAREVHDSLGARPLSHRDRRFALLLQGVKARLRALTRARHVAVLLGSGTLANDVVAGQLSLLSPKGLILANGEFGERLIDHARRWSLSFETYRCSWGEPFDPGEISRRIATHPAWVWMVHCETSTGMLNDLELLHAHCKSAGTPLCLDAISSIGTVDVDLGDVAFATAVSGKGLGAFPGLSMVFHRDAARPGSTRLPRYLDLALYADEEGVPFTHSSNLVSALSVALQRAGHGRYASLRRDSALLRELLAQAGLDSVSPAVHASPGIVTVALPPQASSSEVAARAAEKGLEIAFNSRYLIERNWIQIALMGEYSRTALTGAVSALTAAERRQPERLIAVR